MGKWLIGLFILAVAAGYIVRLAVDRNEQGNLIITQRQLLEVQEKVNDRNDKLLVLQKQLIAAMKENQDPKTRKGIRKGKNPGRSCDIVNVRQ